MNESTGQAANLEFDAEVDASGLPCPLPLLKMRLELNRMDAGQVLRIIASDAGTQRDFRVFADQTCHELLREEEEGGIYRYWMRVGVA